MSYIFVRITETDSSPIIDDAFAIMIHADYNFKKRMQQIHNRCVPLFLEEDFYSVNFFDDSHHIVSQDFLVKDESIYYLMTENDEFLDFIVLDANNDFCKSNYVGNSDSYILVVKKDGIMWRISSTYLSHSPFETETIPWDEILPCDEILCS